MTEAVFVAVIGAIATVVAAWLSARRRSTPVPPRHDVPKPVPRLVAIRAHDEKFVTADRNRGGQLVADRFEVGEWERFFLHDVGDGLIRLQSSEGRFVSAESGGGREVAANRDAAGDWETFRLFPRGPRRVALQSHGGLFVTADANRGGLLVADRVKVQVWEEFEVLPVG